jgi:hypothetical protein
MDLLQILGAQEAVDDSDTRDPPVHGLGARRLEHEVGRVPELTAKVRLDEFLDVLARV